MTTYHLAQINIAKAIAPLDSPVMAEFMANLPTINALGEGSPGYVWRLEAPEGDVISTKEFDEAIIVNLTVWESIEALHQFTYSSQHTDVFRRRREWFEKLETPVLVLWWIPAGHIPTVDEAKEKLMLLETQGATPLAFTFKQRFTPEQMLEHITAAHEA